MRRRRIGDAIWASGDGGGGRGRDEGRGWRFGRSCDGWYGVRPAPKVGEKIIEEESLEGSEEEEEEEETERVRIVEDVVS